MEIEYTDYSEMKIAKRELSKTQIGDVLKNPDKIVEGKLGRKISQKVVGKYLWRVVFEDHGNRYKVVTIYYTQPERYK